MEDFSDDYTQIYCFCLQAETMDMIACDNRNCELEWFHLSCVGLTEEEVPEGEWFCDDCRPQKEILAAPLKPSGDNDVRERGIPPSRSKMATNGILDTDSEDELPAGWEERVTLEGKVYYANHNVMGTQWVHPVSGKKKKVAGELPYGWERNINEEGNVFYVDHINKKTTYTDPRLAFAVEDTSDDPNTIKQRFDGSSTAQQILVGRDLTGKYAIVTGANSGIGYETARSLALHGCHVVMACRNMKAANLAASTILKERSQAKVQVMHCDLGCLTSVKHFTEEYISNKWPLHMLILNAGVFSMPYTVTEDGYEATFQINHLSHFYMTQLLESNLIASAPARIVLVSSESHTFTDLNYNTISEEQLSPPSDKYRPILAYNQSKLCNVLLQQELFRRLFPRQVAAFAVHPGNMMSTGLTRHWWLWKVIFTLVRPFTKSKEQGASTTVYCATARELEGVEGGYFNNCFKCKAADEALRPETANKLWDLSVKMVQKALKRKEAEK